MLLSNEEKVKSQDTSRKKKKKEPLIEGRDSISRFQEERDLRR